LQYFQTIEAYTTNIITDWSYFTLDIV